MKRSKSTVEVARKVGVHPITLERWLAQGKVKAPKRVVIGARASRIWTDRDIARLRVYKRKFYRKGRGRKPKRKGK